MVILIYLKITEMYLLLVCILNQIIQPKNLSSDLDVELDDNMEDKEYLKMLNFYLNQLNQENFDYVFYIAGVDIHFNDRLGKLKISDEGIRKEMKLLHKISFQKAFHYVEF